MSERKHSYNVSRHVYQSKNHAVKKKIATDATNVQANSVVGKAVRKPNLWEIPINAIYEMEVFWNSEETNVQYTSWQNIFSVWQSWKETKSCLFYGGGDDGDDL